MARLGYLGNKHLPLVGQQHDYTAEQIEELIKCRDNVEYFAAKYFTIVHVDHGKMKIPLYKYQKKLLKHIDKNRFSAIIQARQSGKCLQSESFINIRNKKTNVVEQVTIGELYERSKAVQLKATEET